MFALIFGGERFLRRSMVNYQTDNERYIHCRDMPSNEEWLHEDNRNRNRLVLVSGETQ